MPGLGPNSPVKLQLSRDNFNALIGRHAQPVRWLVSEKCPCVKNNQKVDENCPFCNGNRWTYYAQTESIRVENLKAPIDGVIDQDNVISVRDSFGNELTITDAECVTYVDGVKKGYDYTVTFKEDITQSGSGTAQYVDDKLYRIDLPVSVVFGTVQGELLTVSAQLTDSCETLTVTNIFRNCFEISETIESTDEVSVTYTYVDPFRFALINNNFTKDVRKFLVDKGGDGIMIFPQRWTVDSNDVVIALNSTQINKVIFRSTGDKDSLPNFYIDTLNKAYSIRSGVRHEFDPDVDFILYKNNQIIWITDNKPNENEQVSFNYSYNTVYRVLQDMTDPRTSEDNRFPRKVALKLESGFDSREDF